VQQKALSERAVALGYEDDPQVDADETGR